MTFSNGKGPPPACQHTPLQWFCFCLTACCVPLTKDPVGSLQLFSYVLLNSVGVNFALLGKL